MSPVVTVIPEIEQGNASFYADDQIDAVWANVVKHYPALPVGYAFKKTAPSFFHPADSRSHSFQTGLPEEIAARLWRCAWLDVGTKAASANALAPLSQSNPASSTYSSRANDLASISQADAALSKYSSLPKIASLIDVKGYSAQIADYALQTGQSTQNAEFGLECTSYLTDMDRK